MGHCKDCVDCVFMLPEEAGRLEVEAEQSERKREEKQRARGPEGQRPLIPTKVLFVYSIRNRTNKKKKTKK